MQTVLLEIEPFTRFHFGEHAVDNKTGLSSTSSYMHSDSLFSALVNNLAKVSYDKASALVDLFKSKKTSISSLFYCLTNGTDTTYLLPKPVNSSIMVSDEVEYHMLKEIKKTEFLSKTILETYGENWIHHIDKLIRIGSTMVLKDEFDRYVLNQIDSIYWEGSNTHINSRPKDKNLQNELFQTAFVQMPCHHKGWKTNFYFLIDDKNLTKEEYSLLQLAIDLIRFEGLGGKRNSGYGSVNEVQYLTNNQFLWQKPERKTKFLTLGLTIPEDLQAFQNY
jgi:CRISPR-associated protein Csm4